MQEATVVNFVRDDGGWDQSGEDADERCRWTDESAETGKAGTKANITKGNRM